MGCTKLSYDHINLANLTSMGEYAFGGVKVTKMSLPLLTTTTDWSYGHKTFGEYEYLKEISCPNLTSIGKYAFYDYSKLENIDINWENITTLEYGAFANVPMSFDELRLTSLQKMGNHVFNIAKIKKIVLGNNSTQLVLSDSGGNDITYGDKDYLEEVEIYGTDTIPRCSFYTYSKLSKVKLPNNLWKIGNGAFYNCTSLNYDTLSFPELVILEENAFYGVKIRKMELNNITTLGALAVGDKTTLEELTLSPNLTTLVYKVFGGYTNLSKINGLEGVTKFSRMSFSNCNKLKYLHFPNIITAGDDGNYEGAFSGSKNMNITLHLGASCKTIGALLLSYCTDCSMAIICEATTPPEFGSSPFHASARTSFTGIYVPDEVVSSYQGATGWSAYADKIKGISDFLVDNTELYEEIKDSLVGLVKGMRLLPTSHTLFKNQLQVTCYYDGEIITPQWNVDGDATIDANGLLTFKAEGEVTVTATYNGVSKSMQYTYALAVTEQAITTETLVRRQSNPNRWNWIVPNQDLKRDFNCSIKVLANSPIKAEIQIGTDPTNWSTSYNLYNSSWITAGNSKSINLNTYNKGTGTLNIGFANNSDNGFVTVDMIKQYVRILYWN